MSSITGTTIGYSTTGIDSITIPSSSVYTTSTSISRYIDADDVYIDGVRVKDYIDKKFADAGSFHPNLDARKFKTVMGSF